MAVLAAGLLACPEPGEPLAPSSSPSNVSSPLATPGSRPLDFACPDPRSVLSQPVYSWACVYEEEDIRYLLVAVNSDVRGTLQQMAQGDFGDILEKGGLRFMPCQTVVWTHAIKAIPTDDNAIPCWEPQ